MWICKAVFALAVVLFTVKAQELEETEGKKINIKMSYEVLEIGCCGNSYFPYYIWDAATVAHCWRNFPKLIFLSSSLTKK